MIPGRPGDAYDPVVSERWTATDLPELDGRTAVVTGANSGIGLVTARELARVGAHVVLAVRDLDRGRAAAGTITGSTEVRRLDLADLASVRDFAAAWDRRRRHPDQQRGGDGDPEAPQRGRVRDAVRHQPPRTLRPHQPVVAAHHRPRGHGVLRCPPDGSHRPRRSELGATAVPGVGGVRSVQAGQPVVHVGASAATHRGRLDGAGPGRSPWLRRHQPAVPHRQSDQLDDDGCRQPDGRPE